MDCKYEVLIVGYNKNDNELLSLSMETLKILLPFVQNVIHFPFHKLGEIYDLLIKTCYSEYIICSNHHNHNNNNRATQ